MAEPIRLLDTTVLVAHEISLANFGGGEGIRDEGLLQSALARPRNLYAYGEPTLFDLAASYTYGIVNNHPFIDGNERTGFLAGAAFLELNGYQLVAAEPEATAAILGVASGTIAEDELADWFQTHSREA